MTEDATTVGDDGKLYFDMVYYFARTWTTLNPGHTYKPQTLSEYAQHYRDYVTRGIYKQVGHDQIEGRDTVHLQHHASFDTPVGTRVSITDIWVDALTYLPVRQRNSTSGMSGVPQTSQTDYDWLPRTAENLLQLELIVPDGFKHLNRTIGTSSSGSGTSLFSSTFTFAVIHHD